MLPSDVPLPEVFADVSVGYFEGGGRWAILYREEENTLLIMLKQLWPLLTDDERRLMLGAALVRTVGEHPSEVWIGKQMLTLWTDGEVWIDLPSLCNKVVAAVKGMRQKAEEAKHAATA